MPKKAVQGPCCVVPCGRPIEVRNWCGKHYRMQRLYGRTELKNTGERFGHPLYHLWYERKDRGSLCPEWAADFRVFAAAVGDRPGADHTVKQIRRHEPYGPGNWRWVELLKRREGETVEQFNARKWSSRRKAHPHFERRRHLIRHFGLSPEQYDDMLAAQDGKCAICRQAERRRHKATGEIVALAVDHDHSTGELRALLCWRCNATIGRVNESPELLEAMAAYLRLWAGPNRPGRPAPTFAESHEVVIQTDWGPLTASEAARRAGLLPATVLGRLRNGWPVDQVLQPLKRPRRKLRESGA